MTAEQGQTGAAAWLDLGALPPNLDRDSYERFVRSNTLVAVAPISVSGRRLADGVGSQTTFQIKAGAGRTDDIVHYRFDVTGKILEEDDGQSGQLEASFFVVIQLHSPAEDAEIDWFGRSSAVTIVHPYLRETISNTALRLAFAPVFLPLIFPPPIADQSFAFEPITDAAP